MTGRPIHSAAAAAPCAQLALSRPASSLRRPPVLTLTDVQRVTAHGLSNPRAHTSARAPLLDYLQVPCATNFQQFQKSQPPQALAVVLATRRPLLASFWEQPNGPNRHIVLP